MPYGSLFLTPFQEQSIALNKTSPQLFPQKSVQTGIKYTPLESSLFSLIFRKSKKQDEHFVYLVSLLKLIVSILPAFVNKNPSSRLSRQKRSLLLRRLHNRDILAFGVCIQTCVFFKLYKTPQNKELDYAKNKRLWQLIQIITGIAGFYFSIVVLRFFCFDVPFAFSQPPETRIKLRKNQNTH